MPTKEVDEMRRSTGANLDGPFAVNGRGVEDGVLWRCENAFISRKDSTTTLN